jgi:hypothetical protein
MVPEVTPLDLSAKDKTRRGRPGLVYAGQRGVHGFDTGKGSLIGEAAPEIRTLGRPVFGAILDPGFASAD